MLPAGRLVGIWFPDSRGRMMGVATMGNNFGGLTMPLLAGRGDGQCAVDWPVVGGGDDASWQAAFVVIGAISVAIALVSLAVVHERPPPRGSGDVRSRDAKQALRGWTVREALRTRGFYALTLSMALATFTYSAILPHVGAHLEIEGLSDAVVLTAVALLAACGMAGKLLFGYVAERITARHTLMLTLTGQCLAVLLMVVEPSRPLVWVSVSMYGLFMGSFGVLSTLIVQEAYGLRYFGSISGMAGMASVVSMVGTRPRAGRRVGRRHGRLRPRVRRDRGDVRGGRPRADPAARASTKDGRESKLRHRAGRLYPADATSGSMAPPSNEALARSRSYIRCRLSQNSGVIPKARPSLNAVSAVMDRRRCTISLIRIGATPTAFARRYWLMPSLLQMLPWVYRGRGAGRTVFHSHKTSNVGS